MPANFAAVLAPTSTVGGVVLEQARVRDLVLIVEDDTSLAKLFTLFVERCHLRVLHARDGETCLSLFAEHRDELALVLMDCGLPDLHGGTLCHRLRAAVPGLPLLITSGRKQEALRALLAKDGPTGFLAKPFLPADVLREVRAMLPAVSRP